jgi:dTDP-glucose pyrophosphorylase
MKEPIGLIALGGRGTRLFPLPDKALLQIYYVPAFYYLLTYIIKVKIKDVIVITSKDAYGMVESRLNHGTLFGMNIHVIESASEPGPAAIFRHPEVKKIGDGRPVLITLDGIYHGPAFDRALGALATFDKGASILASYVRDYPSSLGAIERDSTGVLRFIEKPAPGVLPGPGPYLVNGQVYAYDDTCWTRANGLVAKNGEFQIVDMHESYRAAGLLKIVELTDNSGEEPTFWSDIGTPELALAASQEIARRSGRKLLGSPHLCAIDSGFVAKSNVIEEARMPNNAGLPYFRKLIEVLDR